MLVRLVKPVSCNCMIFIESDSILLGKWLSLWQMPWLIVAWTTVTDSLKPLRWSTNSFIEILRAIFWLSLPLSSYSYHTRPGCLDLQYLAGPPLHFTNQTNIWSIYWGFFFAFNTIQIISRWVVGSAEETSTYSWSRFCTVNCRPTASNYQLSHLRPGREPLRGGR